MKHHLRYYSSLVRSRYLSYVRSLAYRINPLDRRSRLDDSLSTSNQSRSARIAVVFSASHFFEFLADPGNIATENCSKCPKSTCPKKTTITISHPGNVRKCFPRVTVNLFVTWKMLTCHTPTNKSSEKQAATAQWSWLTTRRSKRQLPRVAVHRFVPSVIATQPRRIHM
jgi:hypothetical protein